MPEVLGLEFLNSNLIIKAFLVLFLVFYFFFSILLIRQVQIMTQAISTDLNRALKISSFVNFILALIFLIFALIV